MKGTSSTLAATIIMIVLMLIGAGMWLAIAFSKEENDAVISAFVSYGKWLIIIGFFAAIFSFIYSIIVNPSQLKGVLVGLGAVVVIGGLSYLMADGSDFMKYKGLVDEGTSKMVSAGLNAFYIVGALAILSVLYSGVARLTK